MPIPVRDVQGPDQSPPAPIHVEYRKIGDKQDAAREELVDLLRELLHEPEDGGGGSVITRSEETRR